MCYFAGQTDTMGLPVVFYLLCEYGYMFKKILGKFIDSNEKQIKKMWPLVYQVNNWEEKLTMPYFL